LFHSQSVEALFSHAPGLKVVIPSNPYDAKGLLLSAVQDPNPVLFLEPKLGYRRIRGEVPDQPYTVPIGPARVSRGGQHLTVFAYGMMHALVLEAADLVAAEGIEAEVVDLRTLYPVDRAAILASVSKTGKALIVHEDNLTCGYGAEVAATIAEGAFASLDGPVRRLAGPDVPAVPFSPPLQDWFMMDVGQIAAAIRDLYSY
jgi:2-oxoisovalerate dehydrogenase E1 component beta subunit